MLAFSSRKIVLAVFVLVLLGIGAFVFIVLRQRAPEPIPIQEEEPAPKHQVMGTSVEGREIEAYIYGNGNTHLMFVGGIHGGYEWNSVLLAYEFIDYLNANPHAVPENITVSVIPNANPDGVYAIIGKEGRFAIADVSADKPTEPGRFNANNVDLNRNFDCKWKPESTWRENVVSAGSAPFSEPEAQAIRDFVLAQTPNAVILWHSQANAVYASECETGILQETLDMMNAYAEASGYGASTTFDHYEVTGDAGGWLASIDIPSITVELKTHETIEWEQNLAGINALFEYYAHNTH